MSIIEHTTWAGRLLTVTWHSGGALPPHDVITQASGVCFTDAGEIVLIAGTDGQWGLPGGHPEAGETIKQTLIREVWEEACAVVEQLIYLGAQQVDDPLSPTGLTCYYQTRWWARVRLESFVPRFETRQRIIVVPSAVLAMLRWETTHIAKAILDAALAIEVRYRMTIAPNASPLRP